MLPLLLLLWAFRAVVSFGGGGGDCCGLSASGVLPQEEEDGHVGAFFHLGLFLHVCLHIFTPFFFSVGLQLHITPKSILGNDFYIC